MNPEAGAPTVPGRRLRLRLAYPGRVLLVFTAVAVLPALAFGGAVGLLPALGLALLAAAAVGSYLNLRGPRPAAPEPRRAFAGESFDLELSLRNGSGLFQARDLVLYHGFQGRETSRPVGYVPTLAPGEGTRLACRARLADRGRYVLYRLVVRSGFPLGLFEASSSFDLPADFLALPRLGSVRGVEDLLPPSQGNQTESSRSRTGTEEFHGLREWRQGESLHLVHWKVSARHGKLIARELRGEERPPVHVVLSTAARARLIGRRRSSFEEAVSLAASLAESFLRHGYRLRFTIAGEPSRTLELHRGRFGLVGLLTQLALVQAVQNDPSELLGAAAAGTRRGEVTVFVLSGHGVEVRPPATLAEGSLVVLDVDDAKVERFYRRTRAGDLHLPLLSA